MNRKQAYVFGDSVMKGVIFDETSQHYRLLPKELMADMFIKNELELHNYSSFGSTISKGFKTIKRVVEKAGNKIDYAILEFGGNDSDFNWQEVSANPHIEHCSHTNINDFRDIYREILAYLRAHNIKPIMMNLPPVNGERYFEYISKQEACSAESILTYIKSPDQISRYQELYSINIERLAYESDTDLIDCRSAFLNITDSSKVIGKDGIHPSTSGYHLIYAELCKALEQFTKMWSKAIVHQ